jgi:hypothetical protein
MIPQLINLLIYVVVVGLLIGLVHWFADAVPLPPPINKAVKIIAIVIGALVLILLLLQLAGVATAPLPSAL